MAYPCPLALLKYVDRLVNSNARDFGPQVADEAVLDSMLGGEKLETQCT